MIYLKQWNVLVVLISMSLWCYWVMLIHSRMICISYAYSVTKMMYTIYADITRRICNSYANSIARMTCIIYADPTRTICIRYANSITEWFVLVMLIA